MSKKIYERLLPCGTNHSFSFADGERPWRQCGKSKGLNCTCRGLTKVERENPRQMWCEPQPKRRRQQRQQQQLLLLQLQQLQLQLLQLQLPLQQLPLPQRQRQRQRQRQHDNTTTRQHDNDKDKEERVKNNTDNINQWDGEAQKDHRQCHNDNESNNISYI